MAAKKIVIDLVDCATRVQVDGQVFVEDRQAAAGSALDARLVDEIAHGEWGTTKDVLGACLRDFESIEDLVLPAGVAFSPDSAVFGTMNLLRRILNRKERPG